MRVTKLVVCAIAAVAASHAAAQTRPSTITVAWPAPAGHFQPRVGDIPSNANLLPPWAEQETLDRAFDGKLKICRGC